MESRSRAKRRLWLCFAVCLLLSGGLFSWFLTYGSWHFVAKESFGDFYDYQARSFLEGRWDVPPAAIGNEAFIFEGKTYGYFGPTPALLRLPFAIAGVWFGKLSRLFMLAYFVAALAATFDLLRQAWKSRSGSAAEPPAWALACLLPAVGPGSVVLMLGSRAFIYHEAMLCGIAFALAGCDFTLRWLRNERSPAWAGALACGLLAVQARGPAGLFALTYTGFAALRLLARRIRSGEAGGDRTFRTGKEWRSLRLPLGVGLLSVLGILSFNAVSYLKFHTWEGCPLRYNVQYTRERLAVVGGKEFHLANIPHNLDAYFTGRHFSLVRGFPFFEPEDPSQSVAKGAFLEPGKPISIPFAMPALSLFAAAGSIGAMLGSPRLRPAVSLCWLAALPMTLALCAAIAVSQRYTGDFIPFLAVASSLGLAALAERPAGRKVVIAAAFGLTAASLLTSLLITLRYQGTRKWGVPPEVPARYAALKQSIDGFLKAKP